MKNELKKLSFWELTGKSLIMSVRNTSYYAPILFISYFPAIFLFYWGDFDYIRNFSEMTLIIGVLFLAGHSFATGLICLITWNLILGENVKLLDSIWRAIKQIIPLAIKSIIFYALAFCCFLPLVPIAKIAGFFVDELVFWFIILAVMIITPLALLFLLSARWVINVPVSIIENLGGLKAGKRCRFLLSGSGFWVTGQNLVFAGLVIIYSVAAVFLTDFFKFDHLLNAEFLTLMILISYIFLFVPLSSVFSTLVYCNMRIEKEGFDIERMSDQFLDRGNEGLQVEKTDNPGC